MASKKNQVEDQNLTSANQIMKDLGFNKNASIGSQEAFIKHLIKSAFGVSVETPTEKKIISENPEKIKRIETQMKFSFIDDDIKLNDLTNKKSS